MRARTGRAWVHGLLWLWLSFAVPCNGGGNASANEREPSLRDACANAFDYGEPKCLQNSTLYWGSGNGTDLSCAHCACEDGWDGLDCGRCLDVSVCPSITVDGEPLAATNCTSNTLLLTDEESTSEAGKVFSCSCGGGEDAWTGFLCDQQPDTWIQWNVTGSGTDSDPAFATIQEFAGIHTRTQETWPGQYLYDYPKVFQGSAGPCKVYRDKCLPIEGTDVGKRDCVIFECADTEGKCPPEEYPVCDGYPHCVSPSGQKYKTHTCLAAPNPKQAITIACQEEKVNGSHVCYYQQSGGFAPLSMTCSVGSCLYHGGVPVKPSGPIAKRVSWSIAAQMMVLVSLAGVLLLAFASFFVASDPGSAGVAPKYAGALTRASQRVTRAEDGWDNEDLEEPLLSGETVTAVVAEIDTSRLNGLQEPRESRQASFGSVHTVNLDGGGSSIAGGEGPGLGNGESGPGGTVRNTAQARVRGPPAILRWTKLGYFVEGQGSHSGEELTVLRGVSGFAGPVQPPALNAAQRHPKTEGSLTRSPSGGHDAAFDATPAPARALATMTGILGPSGAGKSSLLDVLAGRKRTGEGRTMGCVSLTFAGSRGLDADGGVEAVRRVAGYVSQEDVLPGTLTCYEHLMFHARLRMAEGTGFMARRERVLALLREFGLERVADSRIGDEYQRGLSGGERRRLSIAAELVSQPALLFLDEPTTGLDAATALRVMTLLRGVASYGTTVLCSLHQPRPRVLNLLDKVILLTKGRVAYFGSPGDARDYFSSVGRPFPPGQPHPADAMLTLCCREDGGDLPLRFRRSRMYSDSLGAHEDLTRRRAMRSTGADHELGGDGGRGLEGRTPATEAAATSSPSSRSSVLEGTELVQVRGGVGGNSAGPGRHRQRSRSRAGPSRGGLEGASSPRLVVQVEALSRRLLVRAVRHPLLVVLHFGGSLAMALCLASVFGGRLGLDLVGAQNRFGALFFILLYLSLLSLTSLPVWREDRRLFMAESMSRMYGHVGYFASVAVTDIMLIRVVPPLAFAVVAYPLMGLNSEPNNHGCLLWFAGVLVLANVTVAMAAMGIGALGLPLDLSNLVGGLMVLLLAAFGKFLLNGTRIPWGWRWLGSVTPLGYAFETLLINEFSDEDGRRPYVIEGSHCSPELPLIKPLGPEILQTFSFSPRRETMHFDTAALACLAMALTACSLVVFFMSTRTKPLHVDSKPARQRLRVRNTTRRLGGSSTSLNSSDSHASGNVVSDHEKHGASAASMTSALLTENSATSRESSARSLEAGTVRRRGGAASSRTVTWNVPPPDASTSGQQEGIGGSIETSSWHQDLRASSATPSRSAPVLLLSWRGLRYSVPLRRKRRWLLTSAAPPPTSDAEDMLVLDNLSGFAGPRTCIRAVHGATDADEEIGHLASSGVGADSEAHAEGIRVSEGTVTAIMGPSGAGKTTLLNALAGQLQTEETAPRAARGVPGEGPKLSGAVRVNGVDVDAAEMRRLSAYVTQEDVLPDTLTCFEHLAFHAHLRLAPGTSQERRCQRVLEVLQQLGLAELRDSRIGGGLVRGISGGEKRRLSIATEMLTRPPLLFLDEPTTGLDSATALRVMKLVADVAARGTTVVCSVHQPRPEVVALIDKVILLSRGRVAFNGPPSEAARHFAAIGRPFTPLSPAEAGAETLALAVNPADAMLDVVGECEAALDGRTSGQEVDGHAPVVMADEELLEQVRVAEASGPPPLVAPNVAGASGGPVSRRISPPLRSQLQALLHRSIMNTARDPYLAGLHLVLSLSVGFVVGSLFRDVRRLNHTTAGVQDRLGVVFLLLLYLSLLCLTSLAAWRKQMLLFRHERASGAYGAVAHLTAAAVVDALACRIIPPFLLAFTVRPLVGLRDGSLPGLIGGLVAFNLSLAGVLAACGAGAKSSQEALALGCLVVLFSALLSGFLVAKDDLPTGWQVLAWMSPIGRGFEAIVGNEFSPYGAVFELSTKIGPETEHTPPMTGDDVLRCFGFGSDRYLTDLGILVAVGACGLALALVFLRRPR